MLWKLRIAVCRTTETNYQSWLEAVLCKYGGDQALWRNVLVNLQIFFCIFYSIKNGPRLKLRNPIWIPLKASVDLIFCRFLSRRIDFSRKLNHSPLWIVAWGHLIMYLYILLCKLTITFQGMKTLSSLKLYRSRNNNVYRRSFIAYLIKSLFSSQPYSIARSTYHCLMLVSAYRIAQFLDCCLQLSQCLKMRTTVDL